MEGGNVRYVFIIFILFTYVSAPGASGLHVGAVVIRQIPCCKRRREVVVSAW